MRYCGYAFSRFSTPTHCPVHPPLPENPYFPEVVPRCCLHRKRKQRNVSDWWSHLRWLGREETAAMMMCSVPSYPVNEKHIFFWWSWWCWWGGIYEVWVKKTWGIPEGKLGTWKHPPYQEHQSWWTSWSWFTCSHVGKVAAEPLSCFFKDHLLPKENNVDVMLFLISEVVRPLSGPSDSPTVHTHTHTTTLSGKIPYFWTQNTDFQSWNTTQSAGDFMQTATCSSSALTLR